MGTTCPFGDGIKDGRHIGSFSRQARFVDALFGVLRLLPVSGWWPSVLGLGTYFVMADLKSAVLGNWN
jgi:hypothetical protein